MQREVDDDYDGGYGDAAGAFAWPLFGARRRPRSDMLGVKRDDDHRSEDISFKSEE